MASGERCEADLGYRGEPLTVELPDKGIYHGGEQQKQLKQPNRSRHESVNGRFKKFQCLDQKFRYERCKHRFCFDAAVSVLVQVGLEYGNDILFQIDGYATETL